MTDHPITPPQERLCKWEEDILNERDNVDHVLGGAWSDGFRTGADHELKACCDAVYSYEGSPIYGGTAEWLRSMRRPKPPSPKEEALQVLENLIETRRIVDPEYQALRHALEQLDD